MRGSNGSNLYLFEEPTAGLHPLDVQFMVHLFHELADQGHTLYIIEHDPAVIREADYIIDLGPGAGDEGGKVVAKGTPEEIIVNPYSITGRYLHRN